MKAYLLIMLAVAATGCGSKHATPVSYVKSVTALREGDGVQTYFSLADKKGNQTGATGTVHLVYELAFKEQPGVQNKEPYAVIKELTIPVTADQFTEATIGKGAFEHTEYVYNLGRLPYSAFGNPPKWVSYKDLAHSFGRIRLEFTLKNGGTFSGETKYTFE